MSRTLVASVLMGLTGALAGNGQSIRSTADRPDDGNGYQIHLMYAVPSDGLDRHFDTDGSILRSVNSIQQWLAQQTDGRMMKLDTYQGAPDITFLRLRRNDKAIAAFGMFVRDQVEAEIVSAGFNDPHKLYAVYYDGGSSYSCGGGPWPPSLAGSAAVIYLRGTPRGNAPPCDANPFASSVTTRGYREFSMIHEILHTLGFAATCAPDQTRSGHVSDSPEDLMYAGDLPWKPSVLDVSHRNYFRTGSANCLDLDNSAFLTGTGAQKRSDPPPTWPLLQVASQNCILESKVTSETGGPATTIQFVNATLAPVQILWLDSAGTRQFYRTLAPAEGLSQSTFAGHYWIAADSKGGCLRVYRGAAGSFGRAVIADASR